jgi:hypothetical protein
MTIEKIVWYVQHTPHNTNRVVLEQMLKDLILSHGGTLGPDVPDKDVIYDGGIEE